MLIRIAFALIALGLGHELVAAVLLFLVASSLGLWLELRWAAWAWIAIAAGTFVLGAALLWVEAVALWVDVANGTLEVSWLSIYRIVALAFPFAVGVAILRGLRERRRHTRSEREGLPARA